MVREGREIPHGFKKLTLSSIGGEAFMPDGWFYRIQSEPGKRSYMMSREASSENSRMITGLYLNAGFSISRETSLMPSQFARIMIGSFPQQGEGVNPVSELEEVHEGSLITLRRKYSHDGGLFRGIPSEPAHYYFSVTGDDRQDVAYVAVFRTPSERWQTDEGIADTMIGGLTFGLGEIVP